MTSIARRLGVAAVAAVALAGLFVGSGTAGAGIDNNTCFHTGGFIPFPLSSSTPAELHAWYQRECYNPEYVTPLPVSIQRYNRSTGTWTTVASGTGEATYVCHFSTTNTYRSTATSQSGTSFNCG
jgi:hypothetical protein